MRFHLAADDTPIATPTVFNAASIWNDAIQHYGEIPGTRRWSPISNRGKPFFSYGAPHETIRQSLALDPTSLVIRQVAGPFLLLPDCAAAMLRGGRKPLNIMDRGTQAVLASLVWGLYNLSDADLLIAVRKIFGDDASVIHLARLSVLQPKVAAVHTRFGWIILGEGTTNEHQLLLQALAAASPKLQYGGVGGTALSVAIARLYEEQLRTSGVYNGEPVVYAGHSFGGSIVTLIAALATQRGEAKPAGIVTFGMPREITASTLAYFIGVPRRTMRRTGDAVPYLPPHTVALPWLIPLVGPLLAAAYSQYVSFPTETVLDETGATDETTTEEDLPALLSILTEFITLGDITYPVARHGIAGYVGDLAGEPEDWPDFIEDYNWWDEWIDSIVPD